MLTAMAQGHLSDLALWYDGIVGSPQYWMTGSLYSLLCHFRFVLLSKLDCRSEMETLLSAVWRQSASQHLKPSEEAP